MRKMLMGQGFDDSIDQSDGAIETSPIDYSQSIPKKVVVRAAQGLGFFFDVQSGQVIDHAFELFDLPHHVENLFDEWMHQRSDLLDPNDPYRCKLLGTQEQIDSIHALGQQAFDALQTYLQAKPVASDLTTVLSANQFVLAPFNEPQRATVAPTSIRLMLELHCDPLWYDIQIAQNQQGEADQTVGCFSANELGLSWQLTLDLEKWTEDFNESWNYEDYSSAIRWNTQEKKQANEVGLAFLERIKTELAATERAPVLVRYQSLV
jgi:hypothetical protein